MYQYRKKNYMPFDTVLITLIQSLVNYDTIILTQTSKAVVIAAAAIQSRKEDANCHWNLLLISESMAINFSSSHSRRKCAIFISLKVSVVSSAFSLVWH